MRLIFFLLAVSITVRAQERDSLLEKIIQLPNDTERVNQLYKQGFGLRNKDPQLAFEYAGRCKNEALRCHSKKHLAKSYNLLGVLYYKKGDYQKALHYHKEAMALRNACGDVLGMAHSQTNLGNVYSDLKLYTRAENSYLQALDAYRKLNNTEKIISCLVNIGTIKHQLTQYDQAAENYNMALKLCDANDYDARAMCLTNLGEAYVGKHLPEKAIACNQDALKLRIMADNRIETADNYLNLGGIYIYLKEYEKAKYFIDTASLIAKRAGYFQLRYSASRVYSLYYSETGNYEQALKWLQTYVSLGDSVSALQSEEKQLYDFNDLTPDKTAESNPGLHNAWLLLVLLAALAVIPFYLIRYKR